MKPIIEVENLSKRYTLNKRLTSPDTLRESLAALIRAPLKELRRPLSSSQETLWALKEVNLNVMPGEVVGIIGRNGAGKSTLLKVLSRIVEPTAGRIALYGRVGSLLEVGIGFHPELTGRENIYLNGAILGINRKEIERKFDDIVSFAEVEKFIDTPVKRYSSGMYVRLAFAVAAHLESEILLVDEVLAVGDIRFQKKCIDKISEIGTNGRTVLFISHSMSAVARICSRAVLISEGRIVQDGPVVHVVGTYLQSGLGTYAAKEWSDVDEAPGDDVVRLRSVRLQSGAGQLCPVVDITEPLAVEIAYDVLKPGAILIPACRVSTPEGIIIFQSNDWNSNPRMRGAYKSVVWIPGSLLAEGTLYVSIALTTPSPTIKRVFEREVVAFQVVDSMDGKAERSMWAGSLPGIIRPTLRWETTDPLKD